MAGMSLLAGCQSAPPPGYTETAPVLAQRDALYGDLLRLLPAGQRALPAAQKEARWLADTGYKAAASIARINDPLLYCWLNNRLVNSSFNRRERGLCWHYEHDMYRELRRRPLQYFRIGCCVRAQGEGAEHHCVYIAAREGQWPHAMILDAWRNNGRLKVMDEKVIIDKEWKDDPISCRSLANIYTVGHRYPIEHWARVKTGKKWNSYAYSWTDEGRATRQGRLMYRAMEEGLKRRGGKLTDYAEE